METSKTRMLSERDVRNAAAGHKVLAITLFQDPAMPMYYM